MKARWWLLIVGVGVVLILAGCATASTQAPQVTTVVTQIVSGTGGTPAEIVVTVTPAPAESTQAPPGTSAPEPTTAPEITSPPDTAGATAGAQDTGVPAVATSTPDLGAEGTVTPPATPIRLPSTTPTSLAEPRVLELEWPPQMRLGDSDVIRLALIPSDAGYVVTTEFPDHTTLTNTITVTRPGGYDLFGIARLDAAGFSVAPEGEQALTLPVNESVTWRWTITPRGAGQHRLSITLALRWSPQAGNPNTPIVTQVYSRALQIQVLSFFGLTPGQATGAGLTGLVFGGVLSLPLAAYLLRPRRPRLLTARPNAALVIEPHPAFKLDTEESALLQTLFRRYARLVLEAEFRSGYSGARTLLAQPIHADGRADAHTIAKIGDRDSIQREYDNYERYVKDTLPPITARIQENPITLPTPRRLSRAALRYTFIGERGQMPASLRETLLTNPDPAWLEKLFDTFGPNWWMQRKPYTFRLAQEYDRMLPAHCVLEPLEEKKRETERKIDGRLAPSDIFVKEGDIVTVQNMRVVERRQDGKSLSLTGQTLPGAPPVRVRWLGLDSPNGALARVVATRETLLRETVASFDRFGLPDPLAHLSEVLIENVNGTQSIIHGDLNLENILVGPGGFVWLIDFAQTRDGHPLHDFAHLAASLIAQVIAPQTPSLPKFVALLYADADPLLKALRGIAARCLANPNQPREYDLALYMACLGALKFVNLDSHQKHLLYLAAAHLAQSL